MGRRCAAKCSAFLYFSVPGQWRLCACINRMSLVAAPAMSVNLALRLFPTLALPCLPACPPACPPACLPCLHLLQEVMAAMQESQQVCSSACTLCFCAIGCAHACMQACMRLGIVAALLALHPAFAYFACLSTTCCRGCGRSCRECGMNCASCRASCLYLWASHPSSPFLRVSLQSLPVSSSDLNLHPQHSSSVFYPLITML